MRELLFCFVISGAVVVAYIAGYLLGEHDANKKLNVTPLPTGIRKDVDAGISWGGFYVEGDRKSIDAVRDAFNAKERCEALDRMIDEKQLVRPDASADLIEALTNKRSGKSDRSGITNRP